MILNNQIYQVGFPIFTVLLFVGQVQSNDLSNYSANNAIVSSLFTNLVYTYIAKQNLAPKEANILLKQ